MGARARTASLAVVSAIVALAVAPPAFGAFPYSRPGADLANFDDLYLTSQLPGDLCGDGNEPKFSASADPSNTVINSSPVELGGVRGAHVADKTPPGDDCSGPTVNASSKPTAWRLTLGRPDVTIAVLDSGIKWNDAGAMADLRDKVRLNTGELPKPEGCAEYDCNGDGVINVEDYAADSRVDLSDPRRVGPPGVLVPQDLIIAFSDGTDADGNGYVDDIAGWDFFDDDSDPFDDVQYGHGTGEAKDSSSEADNGGQVGSCPNCMVLPLRVGNSFVADVNHFAAAVLYATDNGVDVVQEALGTLNNSRFAREAVEYAYRHGVTIIASAADEAAQHNNWPSSMPHVIVVNSVTSTELDDAQPNPISYLALNGCTNFSAKITLAIPSTSCSSNATGLASGMAGLLYSAALSARDAHMLDDYPARSTCERTSGDPCLITPNEVRQIMASGTIAGQGQADDVDFAGTPAGSANEPSCSPVPAPGCTDPNGALQAQVDANRDPPIPATHSYPARKGPDAFYGYGRVNMAKAVSAVLSDAAHPGPSRIPPEAEITSPEWFAQIDPSRPSLTVKGQVYARGTSYMCRLFAAPGEYPNNALATDSPPGDFVQIPGSAWCDGTSRTADHSGRLGTIDLASLESRFPPGTDFNGSEPVPNGTNGNGRPNAAPHAFTVRVVVTAKRGGVTMTGEDRRAAFLERDQDLASGYPRQVTAGAITGDGASSPAFADLDGDNRNELIYASSDGYVHALRQNGTELPGWPVRSDLPAYVANHTGAHAYESGEVPADNLGGAILASVAVGDTNADGVPEVYAADLEGKVYGWNPQGNRIFTEGSNPDYSGKPLQPFVNVRYEPGQSEYRRTEAGFVASPVLADLDGDGRQELIAAGMDRHVYAWSTEDSAPNQPGGAADVPGFPVLVVDPSKVQSIDPQTHAVTFRSDAASLMQGSIIDTPAIGDIDGDGTPEIVVGTNEEYDEPLNAGNVTTGTFSLLGELGQLADAVDLLSFGNSRVYALSAQGDPDHETDPDPSDAILPGWPFAPGIVNTELLPVVGEGVTGAPVIAPVDCASGGSPGQRVGVLSNNGPAYVLNPDGSSCYGNDPGSGRANALESDFATSPQKYDSPVVPAVGLPAFGDLGGPSPSFLSPAAGLVRALDVAAPDYQGGQDFIGAWNSETGQAQPGFPATMNDLQFITGPSVGDIDGLPGQEVLDGSASMDLAAYSAAGTPLPGWPKLTTDWTVANPLIGSFGTRDIAAGARKKVVSMTRSGYLDVYLTTAPSCSPSSWPRFHHDNANSGDYSRDAVAPGRPYTGHTRSASITWKAPGDDLLCGTADRYEVVTSNDPIDAADFGSAEPLADPPDPAAPGSLQSYELPPSAKRYVAVRAVDEQGNVGRARLFDRGP
jgi:hypothetical protein